MMLRRLLVAALAASLGGPVCPQERDPGAALLDAIASSRGADELPPGFAAAGRGTLLTYDALDETLIRRHGMATSGREALGHLVDLAVLAAEGEAQDVEVSAAELAALWAEVDASVREGLQMELTEYLARQGIPVEEFRETLRLGIVHRELTARALGLPEGRIPTDAEQRLWLDQTIEERGYEEVRPPFVDGVAARCGDGVVISAADFAVALRESVHVADLDEACFHLLLEARLLEKAPALTDPEHAEHRAWSALLEDAIDAELVRRRENAAANPLYQGIPYESLLSAQGFLVEDLRNDPMIRVAALTNTIVDQRNSHAAMKAAYEARQDWYEGRFGEAVRARWILFKAAVFTNELVKRSFADAKRDLTSLRSTLDTEEQFADAAARLTEDVLTKTSGGDLGWVHRAEPSVFPELREAVFAAATAAEIPENGRVSAPVELPEGVALLFLAERRPSPGWGEEMRGFVRQELKRELVEATLLPADVVSFLEAPVSGGGGE